MIIWVKCMYVYKVWMNVREFWSVQALYVTTNALYWKFLEMQNSMHLTLLKHQNTKTSLYELSKNHWVITLLGIFGSDRKKLQFTVPLDHPVVHSCTIFRCSLDGEIYDPYRNPPTSF